MTAPHPGGHGDRAAAALTHAAGFGMYFTAPPDTDRTALSGSEFRNPTRLRSVIDAVGEQIGSTEARVATSTLQFGLAARYWSLVLGVWRCGGVVLDLRGLGYTVSGTGSVAVTLDEPQARECPAGTDHEVAEALTAAVVSGQLAELHAAMRAVAPVAEGMLWGNAASALLTAARTVETHRPGGRIGPVVTAMLANPPLSGRLSRTPAGEFRRRSCCLWYRTRHRYCCGDCPLTGRTVTQ